MSETKSTDSMPVLFFDLRGSWREFQWDEFRDSVARWWYVDIEDQGALRHLGPDGEPAEKLDESLALEHGTHRGMRRLIHERWPTYGEILVRANDGGLVAWVSSEDLMAVFRRAQTLNPSCLERTELGSLSVPGATKVTPGYDELVEMLLEAIDCLGCSEEGMARERELSEQFDAMIGNYAATDRGARLRAMLSASVLRSEGSPSAEHVPADYEGLRAAYNGAKRALQTWLDANTPGVTVFAAERPTRDESKPRSLQEIIDEPLLPTRADMVGLCDIFEESKDTDEFKKRVRAWYSAVLKKIGRPDEKSVSPSAFDVVGAMVEAQGGAAAVLAAAEQEAASFGYVAGDAPRSEPVAAVLADDILVDFLRWHESALSQDDIGRLITCYREARPFAAADVGDTPTELAASTQDDDLDDATGALGYIVHRKPNE